METVSNRPTELGTVKDRIETNQSYRLELQGMAICENPDHPRPKRTLE